MDNEDPSWAPEKHTYTSESESSNKAAEDLRYKKKTKAYSTRVRHGEVETESDSDTSSGSSESSTKGSTTVTSQADVQLKEPDSTRKVLSKISDVLFRSKLVSEYGWPDECFDVT